MRSRENRAPSQHNFFLWSIFFFYLHEFLGGRTIGPVLGTAAAEFESLCSRSVDARLNMPCQKKNARWFSGELLKWRRLGYLLR